MLTTTDDEREIRRGYELGCNVYITKPVNYDTFAQAVRQLGLFLAVIAVPPIAMTAPHRILYIDDEPGLCRLVQRDLNRHGYLVETAPDGQTGSTAPPQPGSTPSASTTTCRAGWPGTLAALRTLADVPPMIFVTGSDEGRIAVAALRAGAADYVIKEAGEDFLVLLRSAIEDGDRARRLRPAHERAEADVREARDRAEELAASAPCCCAR